MRVAGEAGEAYTCWNSVDLHIRSHMRTIADKNVCPRRHA
jgi:hypothetical protein